MQREELVDFLMVAGITIGMIFLGIWITGKHAVVISVPGFKSGHRPSPAPHCRPRDEKPDLNTRFSNAKLFF
jgi:hypothetical protein